MPIAPIGHIVYPWRIQGRPSCFIRGETRDGGPVCPSQNGRRREGVPDLPKKNRTIIHPTILEGVVLMSVAPGPLLVVEDIPHILELLEMSLRIQGYEVVTARDGEEALARIAEERPAIILTDIMMPKVDGYMLAQKIRQDKETSAVPIIFISATYVRPEDKDFAMRLGAVTFMEKPLDFDELFRTVMEVMTSAPQPDRSPLPDERFNSSYQERLRVKLLDKHEQLMRTERLLKNASGQDRLVLVSLLSETKAQCDAIEHRLSSMPGATTP